ncbi:synaptic vesicle glycoprotein 2B-like [Hyposmocoma kahamanoa]|uniref:synaptic vesicle glycoprotein 2B-like n=1 Tax=Hyposmocoma kahamanoa TaxID=1477025 RepID=UPI000E6D8BD7|nr:synaptic vesicle glycoprotein 2B-like [Hyposmocoma kahamanoa]
MTPLVLQAFIDDDHDQITANFATPMHEINSALKECGFGWFQKKLLFASLFAYSCGVFVTSTTPYILPNAECDLNMNLLQKGILNAAPFIGMLISSVIAGFLTDAFGRKIFVVGGHAGIFFFNVISAFSQTYEMLIISKFFEGLLFATALSPCVILTSEYCHSDVRDRVLLFQSSFMALSQVILAALSWLILTQDWETSYFSGFIVLHTWNYYLLIMSLFSLTTCILYSLFPESPKFLVTQNRFNEARETLKNVYKMNTGKPIETFSHANIWQDKIYTANVAPEFTPKSTFTSQLVNGLHNIKPMFRKPLSSYLILICVMNYLIMTLFNIIRLWFPQLSTVVEHYAGIDGKSDLCEIIDAYTEDLNTRGVNVTVNEVCVPTRSGTDTYVNSMILGCVAIMPYILSGILVRKVGKKFLVISAGLLSIAATLWLRWSSSRTEVVGLFAADMAISQIIISLLQATAIEIFPTATRTLTMSLILTTGRIGSMVANVMFPILLDIGCIVPFYTLAGLMICLTILAIFLPKDSKNYGKKEQELSEINSTKSYSSILLMHNRSGSY